MEFRVWGVLSIRVLTSFFWGGKGGGGGERGGEWGGEGLGVAV